MDTQKIAEYQNLKIDLLHTEKEIEERIRLLEKKQVIDTNNPMDYGVKGFSMLLYFDEINIMALSDKNIEKIKQLLTKYQKIRKQQSILELQLKVESQVVRQQMNSIKGFNE